MIKHRAWINLKLIIFLPLVALYSFGEKRTSLKSDQLYNNDLSMSQINTLANNTISESLFKLKFRALSNENLFSKSDVFDIKAYYFLTYNINPYIFFKITPMAQLQSGHIQSIDASDKLENKLNILQGAVFFSWMKQSYLSLGILNAEENYSSILASEKGFFSMKLLQSYINEPWIFGAYGLGAIPNSESSVSNQNEKESTPLLATIGFQSDWKVSEHDRTFLRLSYFKFSQIPTSVSTQSILSGNTAYEQKISDTERNFKYDYAGIDSTLEFKKSLSKKIYALGEGSLVKNESAPESLNQGSQILGGLGINISSNYELEGMAGYYKVEPDAVIAYYANSRFFKTNHQGIEAKGSLLFKKQKFKMSFYFNDSKLIYENPSQSNEKIYFLRFEVAHDAL